MRRKIFTTGAGVAALIVGAHGAHAQETLPTIDVGAERRATSTARTEVEEKTSYRRESAATATKTKTPIMETPVSVQVITPQVIRDQQAVSLNTALKNVSGVVAFDAGQPGDTFDVYIRGFQTRFIYRDGVRMNPQIGGASGGPMMANVDHVEVMKGPASILYGRAEPGGIVNLVMKKPQAEPFYAVEQQVGSWPSYRTTLDATGPIPHIDSVLYRVNVAYENNHGFQDFSGYTNVFVNPTVRWDIDARTSLTAFMEYRASAYAITQGIGAFTNADVGSLIYGARPISFLPRSFNARDPWNRGGSDIVTMGTTFSHDLAEGWNVTHRFQADLEMNVHSYNSYAQWFDPANPALLNRGGYFFPGANGQRYFTNLDVTGKFETGWLEHTLLVGGDLNHESRQAHSYFYVPGTMPALNIFFPTYMNYSPVVADPNSRIDYDYREMWYGFYAQDQIKLPYDLFLLAGVRYDHAIKYDIANNKISDNSDRASPRVGLLWRPIEELSVYGSYTENFGSGAFGANPNGKSLPPQTAQQWEAGVKTELFDKKFTATLAYFNLTKQNVSAPDPNPALAAMGYQVAVGEIQNQGVELDVAGDLSPGWKVIGSYSYLHSNITKDRGRDWSHLDADGNPTPTAGNTGNRLYNTPRHSGSLWMTYELQDSDWRGLRFGGGVVARSLRQGDNENTFQVPGYATIGLMTGYDTQLFGQKVKFQFNVDNLADTRYYNSWGWRNGVYAGAPRSFRGSVRVEF